MQTSLSQWVSTWVYFAFVGFQSALTLCNCDWILSCCSLGVFCLAIAAVYSVLLPLLWIAGFLRPRWLPVAHLAVPWRQLQPRPHPRGCVVRRGARGLYPQVMLTIIRCVGVAESYVLLIAHASSAWAGLWTGESRPPNTRIEWLSKGPDKTEPKQPLVI